MLVGVSTACLFPELLEESIYQLSVNGIQCMEIFLNTQSEMKKSFAHGAANLMKRFDVKCPSVHPFTCELETLMFFSEYERRLTDALEYHRHYFEFMNIVGAEVFVFHGGKPGLAKNKELFAERFSRLYRLGREYGVTVALENVSRCMSASSAFVRDISKMLGDEFAFVLDTKQAVRAGESPMTFLNAVGERTVHVHISDSGELGDCLLIGNGRFDFRAFFEKLGSYNPDASVILELYRNSFNGISDLVSSYNKLIKMTEQYSKEKR